MAVFNGKAEDIENKKNRINSITEVADDEHYPSAKAVLDFTNDSIENKSVQKKYGNRFDGNAVLGYVNYKGFVTSPNICRTSHIYLTAGSYLFRPNTAAFGVANAGYTAKTDADGNLLEILSAQNIGEINSALKIYQIDIAEDGYYVFNIGFNANIANYMIVSGKTIEDFPSTTITHGLIFEDGIHLSATMKEDILALIQSLVEPAQEEIY